MAGELISLLFGEDFAGATTIAQILLLASLFIAGRRVLTDGITGLGYPGYGTIAEVTSWILLLPGLALLLPWLGAEGVALALAISWGASLLLFRLRTSRERNTSARGPPNGGLRRSRDVARRLGGVGLALGLLVVLAPARRPNVDLVFGLVERADRRLAVPATTWRKPRAYGPALRQDAEPAGLVAAGVRLDDLSAGCLGVSHRLVKSLDAA
jgi:hypothetical protein